MLAAAGDKSLGLQGLLRDPGGQEGLRPRRTSRRRTGSWRASSIPTSTKIPQAEVTLQGDRRGLRGPQRPGQAQEVRPVRLQLETGQAGPPPGWEGGGGQGAGFDFRDFQGAGGAGFSDSSENLFGAGRIRAPAARRRRRGSGGTWRPRERRCRAGGGHRGDDHHLRLEEAVRGGSRENRDDLDPNTGQRKTLTIKHPCRGAARDRRSASPARGGTKGAAAARQRATSCCKIEIAPDPASSVEGSGHPHLGRRRRRPQAVLERRGGRRDPDRALVRVRIPAPLLLRPQDLACAGVAWPKPAATRGQGDLLAEIRIVIPEQL